MPTRVDSPEARFPDGRVGERPERLPPLRAPLCPAGHLPRKGGNQAGRAACTCSAALEIGEDRHDSRSPPLRGRCPAGQRGALSRFVILGRSRRDPLPFVILGRSRSASELRKPEDPCQSKADGRGDAELALALHSYRATALSRAWILGSPPRCARLRPRMTKWKRRRHSPMSRTDQGTHPRGARRGAGLTPLTASAAYTSPASG
jgi:hypothetical protein